ncbi:MAG: hypothetical protein QOJ27_2161, partial [Sphingomonadales bacterium]|nr:hypothetical protein [Sphingomonadales bacterium]
VDWDIEAPGLDHYFRDLEKKPRYGVVEFLTDVRKSRSRDWHAYTTRVRLPSAKGSLHVMPAVAGKGDYARAVQDLDWDALYRDKSLGAKLEALRGHWTEKFDFILVDSRTGITDFSGLTTAQLPDILAFMFTANEQSLMGCADVARRAMAAQRQMPLDRAPIVPLPIPARFEQREEYERAKQWRIRFKKELRPFFDTWVPIGSDMLKLIDLLTIPYVPRWTFGEELAVLEEKAGPSGVRSPSHLASYACETLAALISNEFSKIELLTSSRDEYVHNARARAPTGAMETIQPINIYFSVSTDPRAQMVRQQVLSSVSFELGVPVVPLGAAQVEPGSISLRKVSRPEIERANAYVIVVDESFGRTSWLQEEVEEIVRQSLRSEYPRAIIPVVLPKAEQAFTRSKLGSFNAIYLKHSNPERWRLDSLFERLRLQSTLASGP